MDSLLKAYSGDAHVCSCSRHYDLRPAVSVCWSKVLIAMVENNMSEKEPKYYSVIRVKKLKPETKEVGVSK